MIEFRYNFALSKLMYVHVYPHDSKLNKRLNLRNYYLGGRIMRSTGIVRKIDELGRIVIPRELRRTLGIDVKDPLGIFVDGEKILLHKYQPACVFCDHTDGVEKFKGKNVCAKCREELQGQTA